MLPGAASSGVSGVKFVGGDDAASDDGDMALGSAISIGSMPVKLKVPLFGSAPPAICRCPAKALARMVESRIAAPLLAIADPPGRPLVPLIAMLSVPALPPWIYSGW